MPDSGTPWERARKSQSQQQEERTAKMPGARKQPNSGRLWNRKGDVTLDSFMGRLLIDNKTTEGKGYRITREDWLSLTKLANRTPPGCRPALQVDLPNVSLMVFELALWDEIVNYIMQLEEEVRRGRLSD
jgi:hypothetical protein